MNENIYTVGELEHNNGYKFAVWFDGVQVCACYQKAKAEMIAELMNEHLDKMIDTVMELDV